MESILSQLGSLSALSAILWVVLSKMDGAARTAMQWLIVAYGVTGLVILIKCAFF